MAFSKLTTDPCPLRTVAENNHDQLGCEYIPKNDQQTTSSAHDEVPSSDKEAKTTSYCPAANSILLFLTFAMGAAMLLQDFSSSWSWPSIPCETTATLNAYYGPDTAWYILIAVMVVMAPTVHLGLIVLRDSSIQWVSDSSQQEKSDPRKPGVTYTWALVGETTTQQSRHDSLLRSIHECRNMITNSSSGAGYQSRQSPMVPPNKKLEKISMLCLGSRGDIQPYLVLAIALKKKGYQVRFWTSDSYVPLVESFGLVGVAVGTDIEKIVDETPSLKKAMAQGNALQSAWGLAEFARKDAPRICQGVLQDIENHRPDLIMPNTLGCYFGWYCAMRKNIPFFQMTVQDVVYNPDYMFLGLPTLPFGLHYYILNYILFPTLYSMFRPYDQFLGGDIMKDITLDRFRQETCNPTMPLLVLTSPVFAGKLFPTAPSLHMFTGTTVMESSQQVNHPSFGGEIQRFQDFLDQGPAVYVGWGSMISKSSTHMTVMAVRSVRYAQVRAIILGGFAKLSMKFLEESDVPDREELIQYAKDNVMFTDSAPHEWLFPRVTCTVHHGGSGTTTAAMRAGVPTIITPVFLDQYDFSYVVRELGVGVGFSKQLQQIGWQELGEAIKTATTDFDMQDKAAQVGKTLRAERGGDEAADLVGKLWNDFVLTGKFESQLPGRSGVPAAVPAHSAAAFWTSSSSTMTDCRKATCGDDPSWSSWSGLYQLLRQVSVW